MELLPPERAEQFSKCGQLFKLSCPRSPSVVLLYYRLLLSARARARKGEKDDEIVDYACVRSCHAGPRRSLCVAVNGNVACNRIVGPLSVNCLPANLISRVNSAC